MSTITLASKNGIYNIRVNEPVIRSKEQLNMLLSALNNVREFLPEKEIVPEDVDKFNAFLRDIIDIFIMDCLSKANKALGRRRFDFKSAVGGVYYKDLESAVLTSALSIVESDFKASSICKGPGIIFTENTKDIYNKNIASTVRKILQKKIDDGIVNVANAKGEKIPLTDNNVGSIVYLERVNKGEAYDYSQVRIAYHLMTCLLKCFWGSYDTLRSYYFEQISSIPCSRASYIEIGNNFDIAFDKLLSDGYITSYEYDYKVFYKLSPSVKDTLLLNKKSIGNLTDKDINEVINNNKK